MAKAKILIIDDSADTRSRVSTRLKKHQYDTVFAADALQQSRSLGRLSPMPSSSIWVCRVATDSS